MIVTLSRRTVVGGGLWLPVLKPPVEPVEPPVEPPVKPPPLDNAHDKLVMAAPGQVSDAYLRGSALYYLSSEITAAIRKEWNDHVAIDRDNFGSPHKRLARVVNSKTLQWPQAYVHEPVIEPAVQFADEVLFPPDMTQGGVLRLTTRNSAKPKGWASDAAGTRNFRKQALALRLREPHPAYTNVGKGNYDYHRDGVEYETGFTFWQGGTENWLRRITSLGSTGSTCLWQMHSAQGAWIYFQIGSTGSFSGWTVPSPKTKSQSFGSFPMTTGHDDIHVLKIQHRAGSNGYVKIWYNGKLKVDVNRSMKGFTSQFMDIFTYREPFPLNSDVEATLYMDRAYRRAL